MKNKKGGVGVILFVKYLFYRLCIFILIFVYFFIFPKEIFAQVVINEFLPKPVDGASEWVEFYNSSLSVVNLSDFWFDDDTNFSSDIGSSSKKQLFGLLQSGSTCYLDLNKFLNDDKDSPTIFDSSGTIVDTISYSNPVIGKSYTRDPDGGEWLTEWREPTKSLVSCLSLTPLPTPTPTPTQPPATSSVSSNTAIVRINQPHDQNGQELVGSLKIYIDGNYTGNYAPQVYTFGDGKTCGSNSVPCGFGTHTFKVEKTGYIPWTKTVEITAGNNYEFDPVLLLSSPTNTPTVKPTATATASATPKSTLADFSTSTESSSLAENTPSQSEVLGTQTSENETPTPAPVKSDSKLKFAALFFVISGLSFLGSAFYAYLKKKKKGRLDESENKESD